MSDTGNQSVRLTLPLNFTENEGFKILGALQKRLAGARSSSLVIDISKVEWAEPSPLLCLGLFLAESVIPKSKKTIYLGSNRGNQFEGNSFLKFFALHGFLDTYSEHASFKMGNETTGVEELRNRLSSISAPLLMHSKVLIKAKLDNAYEYKNDHRKLQRRVEGIVREAKISSEVCAFNSDPNARDIIFQQLRKLVYELLLNVSEHSHSENDTCVYGAVYARVREPKPGNSFDASRWENILKTKTIDNFGQRNFTPNQYAEWIELYICDIGSGLTSRIRDWKIPKSDRAGFEVWEASKKAPNPFVSIAHRLFRSPYSRMYRHNDTRTVVTGLQHLGHLLSVNGDYCRIYTQNGCWVGNHFPWSNAEDKTGSDQASSFSQKTLNNQECVSGTVYAFFIQPEYKYLDDEHLPWVSPDPSSVRHVIDGLKNEGLFSERGSSCYVLDYSRKDHFRPPSRNALKSRESLDVVLLRPPRLVNKRDVADWVALLSEPHEDFRYKPPGMVILGDLSPFQCLVFYELMSCLKIHENTVQEWYFVSDQWKVLCLSTGYKSTDLVGSVDKSKSFLLRQGISPADFSCRDYAVVLRELDSKLFWNSKKSDIESLFFSGPIEWDRNDDGHKIELERYLDFTLALSDSARHKVALQGLRRYLSLFTNREPAASDDLVSSLVSEATRYLTPKKDSQDQQKEIYVGSILVTEQTAKDNLADSDYGSIYFFIHREVRGFESPVRPTLLLWYTDFHYRCRMNSAHAASGWKRISHTPYIAKYGDDSLPVLRYVRDKQSGLLDFQRNYYPRSPADTYRDFLRLDVLSLGHWSYGKRHDLLTINMNIAISNAFREKGELYDWLYQKIKSIFEDKERSKNFIFYPSHESTDLLFDLIKTDENFKAILPEKFIIPIKFLSHNTVSPLMPTQLVEKRIKKRVKDTGLGDSQWNAVIIDDGIITGKHFAELKQYLLALGANNAYTIAFLDRSGLPLREEILKQELSTDARFWRWDIPGLGHNRACALCQSISISQTYISKITSQKLRDRLLVWKNIWATRDIMTEWNEGRVSPIYFKDAIEVSFGINPQIQEGGIGRKMTLRTHTSHAVTGLLLELTRLTKRTDVGIFKADKIAPKYPDATIELLGCQLLLHLDELDDRQGFRRYIRLLDLCWSNSDTSQMTSFAGLCLMLVEDKMVSRLWNHFSNGLLANHSAENDDAIIAASILLLRRNQIENYEWKPGEDASDILKDNFHILNQTPTCEEDWGYLLNEVISDPKLDPKRAIHNTYIQNIIDKYLNFDPTIPGGNERVNDIYKALSNLLDVLIRLRASLTLNLDQGKLDNLSDYIKRLKLSIKEGVGSERNIISEVRNFLFGAPSEGTPDESDQAGLLIDLQDKHFCYEKNLLRFNTLHIKNIASAVASKWEEIISHKISKKKRNEWDKLSNWIEKPKQGGLDSEDLDLPLYNGLKPEILQSKPSEAEHIWCFFDRTTKRVIEDIFSNAVYASETIIDPFEYNSADAVLPDLGLPRAHLWWRSRVSDEYIIIELANATKDKHFSHKPRVPHSVFERLGGRIILSNIKITDHNVIHLTSVRIPTYHYFIPKRKNELQNTHN